MKFSTGQVVMTPNAQEAMIQHKINFGTLIRRHVNGDWGDVCDEDRQTNEASLKNGGRLMSVYKESVTIWIITEWDRSVTTILLPEDY